MHEIKEGQKALNVCWEALWDDLRQTVSNLPVSVKIYGIPRNGTLLSALACHIRDDLVLSPSLEKDVIVLDDICDSGETLFEYKRLGHKVCVVYLRKGAMIRPDYYGCNIDFNDYLCFPWEKENEIYSYHRCEIGINK